MIWTGVGIVAFALLIYFEIKKTKSFTKGEETANPWFILGTILLVGAFIGKGLNCPMASGPKAVLGVIILAIGVCLYIVVLTGGLSQKNYFKDLEGTPLCTTGAYGIVRHPGVWCFALVSIGFGILFKGSMLMSIFMAILNFVYTLLQDKYFFPVYILGYEAYKKEVPYLFPRIH